MSHKGAAAAIKMGYTNVSVFEKGYPAWKKAHGAGVATKPAVAAVEGALDHDEFKKIIAENPASVTLIDVRDADEFKTGSFKTAISIPVEELEDKLTSLPTDKPIIFVCSTGSRSGEAYYMIEDLKPSLLKNCSYVEAEIEFKKDGSFVMKKTE